MLELAINHKEKLNEEYRKIIMLPEYRFACCFNYQEYDIKLENNSYSKEQYVSISEGKINGFLQAFINRQCNYVDELYIWGAIERDKRVYANDLYKFLKGLYTRYDKIVFSCIQGNKTEKHYDRICKLFGGRIVGIFEEHVTTNDNVKRSQKFYEVKSRVISLDIGPKY